MIRSDNEAVALHREDETVIEEIPVKSSQSIWCNEHDHFLVGGMARALPIDMEKRFGEQWLAPQSFLCRQGRLHCLPEV